MKNTFLWCMYVCVCVCGGGGRGLELLCFFLHDFHPMTTVQFWQELVTVIVEALVTFIK